MMKLHLFRRSVLAASTVALLAPAGCLPTGEYRGPVFWEGVLNSPESSPMIVGGMALMVANTNNSEAGITLDLEWPDVVFSWHVRNGACSGTGLRVAPLSAFGAFSSTADGPSAHAAITRRVDINGTYSAELFEGPDTTGRLLACADLVRL